jgi:hypothetical protein
MGLFNFSISHGSNAFILLRFTRCTMFIQSTVVSILEYTALNKLHLYKSPKYVQVTVVFKVIHSAHQGAAVLSLRMCTCSMKYQFISALFLVLR